MYQLLVNEIVQFTHQIAFDPTYGYNFEQLKQISHPKATPEFINFWETTYQQNLRLPLNITVEDTNKTWSGYKVKKLYYDSWDNYRTGAWVLEPLDSPIKAGLIIGHGYGGRDTYSVSIKPAHTAIIMPVARGFHISASNRFPGESSKHVIHQIDDKETYVIRGCVAEIWSSISCLYELYPQVKVCNFSGTSFGGGLGALMAPFEKRLNKVHLSVPTFGNHPIRLKIPCTGSGESVRQYFQTRPNLLNDVLSFYDAATAASLIKIPSIITPALFDPAVPPPGQFSVANAIPSQKKVLVYQSGHFDTKVSSKENRIVDEVLTHFFQEGLTDGNT